MKKIIAIFSVITLSLFTSCQVDDNNETTMPNMSGKTPIAVIEPRTQAELTARYDTDFQCVDELDCAGFAVQEDIENPEIFREMQCHVTWKSRNQIGQWYGTVACDSGREYFFIYWHGSVALYP